MTNHTTTRRPGDPKTINGKTGPGLHGLLERRKLWRISRDGIVRGPAGSTPSLRVLPSGLDAELCHAVDIAASQHRPLVVVLPLTLPAAPVAVATAVTIAAIAASGRVQARTAVVSPRLAGRQMYDELLVDREQLSALVPRTVAGEGCGESTVITAHDCGQLLAAESLDTLTGVVLDLRAVEPSDLDKVLKHAGHRSARRPILLVAIASSPLDPAIAPFREANALVYAVDQRALARQALLTPVSGPSDGSSLVCGTAELTRASVSSLDVRECGDHALDEALAAMWAEVAALGMASGSSGSQPQAADLRWAWAVTSLFSQLPTSAARADHHAQRGPWAPPSLLEAAGRARDLAIRYNESMWLGWGDAVDAAVTASGAERKASALALIAAEQAAAGQPVLVLTRNRASAAALRSALLEDPAAPAEVPVASMRDFAASRNRAPEDALVVIPGPLPRSYSGWMCVPPAAGLAVLTAGPWQTHRTARQVIDARAALSRACAEARAGGLAAPEVPAPRSGHGQAGPPDAMLATVTSGGAKTPFEASQGKWADLAREQLEARIRPVSRAGIPIRDSGDQGVWIPFEGDALAILEQCADRVAGVADQMLESDVEGGTGAGQGTQVLASGARIVVLPITLRPLGSDSECVLLHPPGETITRRDGLQVKAVAARALRPGDLVALVDGQARQDLFAHVVETLEESPQWGVSVALARLWQKCVQRIPDCGMTYEEIRRRSGISVQASEIGMWARGQAECPRDPEDVRRLARVMRDNEVLSRAEAVATALRALWHLHQLAGRWLSARLSEASHAGLGDDAIRGRTNDEIIDPVLGFRASDLLGSIRLYQVARIGTACSAPSGATGTPLPPSDAVALCMPVDDANGKPAQAAHRRSAIPGTPAKARAGTAPASVVKGVIEGVAGAPLGDEEALSRLRSSWTRG